VPAVSAIGSIFSTIMPYSSRMPQDMSVSPTMIGGEIPLIDVADTLAGKPGAAAKAAAQLRYAFENVGFYYLAGHGVPPSLIDAQYAEAARFHALPSEAKLAVKVDEHNIGYMPIPAKAPPNAAAQGKKPSQNEAFFLRRERTADDPDVIANRRFHTMNKWPAGLAGFREQTLCYMNTLEALCQKLVPLYALALDLPADYFDRFFVKPHIILRQSRYPLIDGGDDSVASLVPHTDSGFMTLLPPNKVQGLDILLPSGRWMSAPTVEGAYVVNGGDILHRWTNERFLSTPHRVRNVSGVARYAIPFFFDPDHDTVIECLPSCQSADHPPKYPPIKFADYALWFSAQRYQHMQTVKAPTAADVSPGARATEAWKS
jgi:isopenicillin N synthase-like dioxygenase